MRVDPFRISDANLPAIVAFSGGRTSGYMLHELLRAHGGSLPEECLVSFQNTGVEREETLRFVQRVSERWGVRVRWLEYRREFHKEHYEKGNPKPKPEHKEDAAPRFVEVDFQSASRRGEPFFQLIEWAKAYRAWTKAEDPVLPNPVQRMCTGNLKIRTCELFMASLGHREYTSVLGIRADEPGRVSTARHRFKGEVLYPLHSAGVMKRDVLAFWKEQPFDLELDPNSNAGNCTLCFLKSTKKIVDLMLETEDHDWFWLEAEELTGTVFRRDRPSYAELRADIRSGKIKKRLGLLDDKGADCFCGPGED